MYEYHLYKNYVKAFCFAKKFYKLIAVAYVLNRIAEGG
jgi:hypothetical protein